MGHNSTASTGLDYSSMNHQHMISFKTISQEHVLNITLKITWSYVQRMSYFYYGNRTACSFTQHNWDA
jgi:hypothetical protein